MDTPELDDAINVLKILKSRGNGELTERGELRLLEYETIKNQLTIPLVSQQRELLDWLSNEPFFNIPKDEISEILEDWQTYKSNCG